MGTLKAMLRFVIYFRPHDGFLDVWLLPLGPGGINNLHLMITRNSLDYVYALDTVVVTKRYRSLRLTK